MARELTVPVDQRPQGLAATIEAVSDLCSADDVAMGDLAEGFGRAGVLPLILLPALIAVSPISIIPLMPTMLGLIIALASVQLAIGRRSLWLPGALARRSVPAARLRDGLARILPFARWLDRRAKPRFGWLARRPLSLIPTLVCVACGLVMPFLELIPMSATLLGATALLIGLGLLVRDGLLVLLGYVPLLVAGWVVSAVVSG